ncbi:hypothetical protein BJY04DRAFT_208969 [Aspergillus karnatakaensis]|uniref:uncharacterized protein n=1 Tax=Aspergillus karnatakaensis TaxID=1810916 RepID=UPI003CCD0B37
MGALSRGLSGLASAVVLFSAVSHGFVTRRDDIRVSLKSQLSENADIYFPDEEIFEEATERWSDYAKPNFTVVVEVAEEEDVVRAVQYANAEGIPYLAVNGGHGAISSLAEMQHGIQIWLQNLNFVDIAEDGHTATFGGGIKSADLIPALYEHGKQTVHGVCECVSYLGPALGGGHGVLQGKYGVAADQLLSVNIVTADGVLRTVNEDNEEDLWWALRGAGHNFGIVTSVTSKIYDVPHDGLWAYEQLLFNGDHVEELFERFNELLKTQPPGFLVWTYLLRVPPLDPDEPVYLANFMQEGVKEIDYELIDPFRELSDLPALNKTTGLYTDIPRWITTDVDSRGCAKEENKVRFPIGFPKYNPEAQREFYHVFAEGTAEDSLFNASMVLLEQYSSDGVKAVPSNSTAFPDRNDDLLVSPVVAYPNSSDYDTELLAREFGNKLRDVLLEGTGSDKLHAYVNYAAGDEGPHSWYGHEPWRLEKLKALKKDTAPAKPAETFPEPPKVAITPCEGPARYYFEGGLRRVHPYHYTYNTYCKERWRDRELIDIFTSEFRDREPDYYRKALERGQVTVNGKPAGPHTVLKNGQVLSHTLHRHEPPVTGNSIGIIHESDDLLVIDKPAGVPVHSTGRYHYNSCMEILRIEYNHAFVPRPCNRLDRLTSGVMFVGKTAQGADGMTKQLKERSLKKEYVARVKGRFPDGVTVVDMPIMSVNPKVGLNRVRATGKEATTRFRRLAYYPPTPTENIPAPAMGPTGGEGGEGVGIERPATPPPSYINENEGYSIVHCLPLTGRTHQIRVHLQFLGHPISNDPIYSNRRVFGPSLGKNDDTADRDGEIIERLMAMGRTELPETVSYRTHFTTPPVVPPGTDSSLVEAIMSKEHDAAVERYHKRKGEKLSGEVCDVCGTGLYTDPGVHELGIFLHAVAYAAKDGEWAYRSKMPTWALPPAGCEGPTEVPDWVDLVEGEEEVVLGDGVVPEIGDEEGETDPRKRRGKKGEKETVRGDDGVTALVEGVGYVYFNRSLDVR